MKIKIRKLVATSTDERTMILEEVEASPVQGMKDCAIVHHRTNYYIHGKKHSSLDRWVVYDIPTGLLIVYGYTRKECLENLLDARHLLIKTRDTELYQRRIKEFEELQKL